MPGLIEADQGLSFGQGLIWLAGGLGGDGLVNPPVPDLYDRFEALIHDRSGEIIELRTSAPVEPTSDIIDRSGAFVYGRDGANILTRDIITRPIDIFDSAGLVINGRDGLEIFARGSI